MSKPKAIYIIGGAGSGKSTLTKFLLDEIEAALEPLSDIHVKPNKKNDVTLRGQYFESLVGPGLYLGLMRDKHPGTDGLDRASTPTAVEWLELGEVLGDLPMVLAEGATLSTKGFFQKLSQTHELLVLHLTVDDEERERRFAERGTNQKESFVRTTITRSQNMAVFAQELGADVLDGDTSIDGGASSLIYYCIDFLNGELDD